MFAYSIYKLDKVALGSSMLNGSLFNQSFSDISRYYYMVESNYIESAENAYVVIEQLVSMYNMTCNMLGLPNITFGDVILIGTSYFMFTRNGWTLMQ